MKNISPIISIKDNKSLDGTILSLVSNGSRSTHEIFEELSKTNKVTKQGFYKALRKLKKDGVVVIHNKNVSLNIVWLKYVSDYVAIVQHYYLGNESSGSFVNLKDGERIRYNFKNAIDTDNFWNHALFQILEITSAKSNFVAYGPHVWFFLVRVEDEKALMRNVIGRRRKYLVTAGANTLGDKEAVKYFDNNKGQYKMLSRPLFEDNRYYLNIVGDYLIEVWLDKNSAKLIDDWYRRESVDNNNVNDLRKIIEQRGRIKMVISRNSRKAEKLSKKLLKDFVV